MTRQAGVMLVGVRHGQENCANVFAVCMTLTAVAARHMGVAEPTARQGPTEQEQTQPRACGFQCCGKGSQPRHGATLPHPGQRSEPGPTDLILWPEDRSHVKKVWIVSALVLFRSRHKSSPSGMRTEWRVAIFAVQISVAGGPGRHHQAGKDRP